MQKKGAGESPRPLISDSPVRVYPISSLHKSLLESNRRP
jgi:hypothetical protein